MSATAVRIIVDEPLRSRVSLADDESFFAWAARTRPRERFTVELDPMGAWAGGWASGASVRSTAGARSTSTEALRGVVR
jgi:hypothetical protein